MNLEPGLKLFCRFCGRQLVPKYRKNTLYDGYTGIRNPEYIESYQCPKFGKYERFLGLKTGFHDEYINGSFEEYKASGNYYA